MLTWSPCVTLHSYHSTRVDTIDSYAAQGKRSPPAGGVYTCALFCLFFFVSDFSRSLPNPTFPKPGLCVLGRWPACAKLLYCDWPISDSPSFKPPSPSTTLYLDDQDHQPRAPESRKSMQDERSPCLWPLWGPSL